jgi:hypothetical protein
MKRINKVLNLLIIVALAAALGCAPRALKSEDKNGEFKELSFIDWSDGLPSTGQWRQGIAFYDINGDGHLDIAAPPPRMAKKGEDTPVIWYGDGKGKWSMSRPDVPSDIGFYYGGITMADFDCDGIADMALAMHGMGVKVLKGKGDEKYVDFSEGFTSGKEFSSRAIVSADFNNDGRPEIAAVSEGKFAEGFPMPSGVVLCLREDKAWKCHHVGEKKEVVGLFADQLTTGDVNGDGNKDIAVASLEHLRNLIVWIGDGKGGFTAFNKGLPQERHYLSVGLADINRDGKDDLVAGVSGFGDKAFKGLKAFLSGPDTFKEISEGLPTNEVFVAVSACDLDGDGSAEIVAGAEGVKIFSYKEGRWRKMSVSGLPEKGLKKIRNIYLIDVNKDGRKDIVFNHSLGQNDSGGIRVFLNTSHGTGKKGKKPQK